MAIPNPNRILCSDHIFDGRNLLEGHALVFDAQGQIIELLSGDQFQKSDAEYLPGLICPGFVNAHGHLELSHMKGRVNAGTGLIPFLKAVVSLREVDPAEIEHAIIAADEEMWREGIVAAGDISNKRDTIPVKSKSPIRYFTFIEAFDLWQDTMAETFYKGYQEVYEAYGDLPKSLSPHAPYSVSPTLFEKIKMANPQASILSIHNQEVSDENLLFLDGSGGFKDFIQGFGFSMDHFKPTGRNSVYYAMAYLEPKHQMLFVHNTLMAREDIRSVLNWNPRSYFVSCPNANLYIENRLPRYEDFRNEKAKVCLGTDSLTSNWRLSILEEIKTVLKYQASIPVEEVFQWACLNGAEALGMEAWAGSFEPGKKPGILWIQEFSKQPNGFILDSKAQVKRII
jgi:cytosine/adenosine deaminase-related metal-dependent hydrolase